VKKEAKNLTKSEERFFRTLGRTSNISGQSARLIQSRIQSTRLVFFLTPLLLRIPKISRPLAASRPFGLKQGNTH
jgi:hypothetical protein